MSYANLKKIGVGGEGEVTLYSLLHTFKYWILYKCLKEVFTFTGSIGQRC